MNPSEYLEKNHGELVRRAQDMVRIATVNPPGRNYRKMVELLLKQCRDLGMKAAVHRVPDAALGAAGVDPALPRYNLVARWDVGAAQSVHFNAHYDVVPAAGRWRCGDPFGATLGRGWLYGRGAGDMKGSIAALLAAVEALKRCGATPAFNVECSFTADEESGGLLGAGYVVRQGLVEADYAVVCEGASGRKVGCGHNGVLWLEVEIEGKAAHASSPHQGINAFEGMAALVCHLQELKKSLAAAARRYRDFNGQERNPTINLGGVFGGGEGDKVNTVPAAAHFSIDRRLVPGEHLEAAEEELRRVLVQAGRKVPQVHYRAEATLRIEPCVVDCRQVLPQSFARAVQAVRRQPAEFRTTPGFTDLHFFVVEGGLPGLGYGVDGRQAHAIDERLRVRDLLQTARTYAEFMQRGIEAG